MPLHEKRFDPNGKLVVSKGSGMNYGGRFYAAGDEIPGLPMRKARQLYFQNKLCYDYEIAAAQEERKAAQKILAARSEAALAGTDRTNIPNTAQKPSPILLDDREIALRAKAAEIRAIEKMAEDAELAAQKAAYEARQAAQNPGAPVVATSGYLAPASPAEAVSEAPVVVVEPIVTEPEIVADEVAFSGLSAVQVAAEAQVTAPTRRRIAAKPETSAAA